MANAFIAAQNTGFKLFISFDYTGLCISASVIFRQHALLKIHLGGTAPWPEGNVISLLNTYKASSAYYKYLGKPFVSTFEGVDNSADWTAIKAQTGCFFVPSWSSLGPQAAVARGTADGLFSWNAYVHIIETIDLLLTFTRWPWGDQDMNTYTDASYLHFLNQTGVPMPYMMPVSPVSISLLITF